MHVKEYLSKKINSLNKSQYFEWLVSNSRLVEVKKKIISLRCGNWIYDRIKNVLNLGSAALTAEKVKLSLTDLVYNWLIVQVGIAPSNQINSPKQRIWWSRCHVWKLYYTLLWSPRDPIPMHSYFVIYVF